MRGNWTILRNRSESAFQNNIIFFDDFCCLRVSVNNIKFGWFPLFQNTFVSHDYFFNFLWYDAWECSALFIKILALSRSLKITSRVIGAIITWVHLLLPYTPTLYPYTPTLLREMEKIDDNRFNILCCSGALPSLLLRHRIRTFTTFTHTSRPKLYRNLSLDDFHPSPVLSRMSEEMVDQCVT